MANAAAALFFLLALFFLPLSLCSHSKTFFVLGDWGSAAIPIYAPTQKSVAKSMKKLSSSLKPNFIISTGDNFYNEGVMGPKDPLWKDAWSDMYEGSSLNIPWYISLGNHDYMGSVDAQLQYKEDDRWILPQNYYSVKIDYLNLTIVILDTTPLLNTYRKEPENAMMEEQLYDAPDSQQQYDWLDRTLAAASKETRWTVVVGHHQIYSAHGNGTLSENGFTELQLGVEPLLTKHKVHAYLCGHVHDLQHIEAYGVHHFVSGAGSRLELAKRDGEISSTKFFAELPGFLSITVDTNYLNATFYGINEHMLYSTRIFHNETIILIDNRILGLKPSSLYALVFGSTFALIGLAVLSFFLYRRYQARQPKKISLPLEETLDDTDALV